MRTKTKLVFVTLLAAVGLLVSVTGALAFVSGLTVDSTVPLSVNRTAATVSGTIQCTGPGFVGVELIQGKGSTVTVAQNETPIVCDGTVQSWSVIVSTPQGATWQTGKATADVFAQDIDNFREIQTTVRLTSSH